MRGANDRGFVLVAIVWLLLLGATIAAALTLRALAAGRTAAAEGEGLATELALDGAAQTVLASLLFEGPRSPWAAGAAAPLTLGGRHIQVKTASEEGRIDANTVDPAVLNAALQGVGVAAPVRERLSQAVRTRRAERRDFTSAGEVRAWLRSAGDTSCLDDLFTVYARLQAPSPGQMPARLARALASAAPERPPLLSAATPLRIEAALAGGPSLTAVARLTGLPAGPVSIHRWEYRLDCG